jgi:transcriptional regulator with XRE-family HTH domain
MTMMPSRLGRFMTTRRITIARFARASGRNRQYLARLVQGTAQPTASTIKALVIGARIVTNDPSIRANELFPLDDDE